MRHLLSRWHFSHQGLAVGLVVALVAFAFLCPIMLPSRCSSGQQSCQSQTCWLLASGPMMPVLIVLAWLLWATRVPLLREYPLLLFRPPRPCLLPLP